jgi:hypothetical protein
MFFLYSFTQAQIERVIDDFEPVIKRSIMGGPRPFIGVFEFISLPEPLKPARVEFTLEVTDSIAPYLPKKGGDWLIKLHYLDYVARATGDTLFYWAGPHQPGDKFSDYIEFVPLQSGKWGMNLYLFKIDNSHGFRVEDGIGFDWCLDENGELLYLGKNLGVSDLYNPIKTFYFENDSVIINQDPHSRHHKPFGYKIVVEPIPRIGDTTVINYYLKANEDIPDGCEVDICARAMDYISTPERLNRMISKGENIHYTLKVVPKAVRNGHSVTLSLTYISSQDNFIHSQTVPCCFLFDHDGLLRYVNNTGFDFVSREVFPSNLPWSNSKRDVTDIFWDSLQGKFIRR